MSGRWKRKDGHNYAIDSSDGPPKKASKTDFTTTTTTTDNDDSGDIVVCEISKNRRVTVRNWQGKIWVDIREFYLKDGKQLPGKKGISLSVDQWNVLRDHAEEVDKALADS